VILNELLICFEDEVNDLYYELILCVKLARSCIQVNLKIKIELKINGLKEKKNILKDLNNGEKTIEIIIKKILK